MIYKQDFYNNKQKEINDLYFEYLVSVMYNIDYPVLIEEWRQNLDADAYKKSIQRCKVTIN